MEYIPETERARPPSPPPSLSLDYSRLFVGGWVVSLCKISCEIYSEKSTGHGLGFCRRGSYSYWALLTPAGCSCPYPRPA